jgi:hypothetical protein
MKYCSNCGTQITTESKFCSGCGAKIAEMPMQEIKATTVMPENKVETTTNRILMPDGAVYEGELKDGIANGYGKYFYPKPDGFEGLWMKPSEDRLVYEGNFLNGKKHGFGKLSNKDYNYEGNWEFNEKSGFGKFTEKSGGCTEEYVGNFSSNKKHGAGTTSTLSYEGEKIITQINAKGSFYKDEMEDGEVSVSHFDFRSRNCSIKYKGSFRYYGEAIDIHGFPAFDGELIFTLNDTGKSSKHIVKNGCSESFDLLWNEVCSYVEYNYDGILDDDDEEDDYDDDFNDDDDSPIKPKDGAGLR